MGGPPSAAAPNVTLVRELAELYFPNHRKPDLEEQDADAAPEEADGEEEDNSRRKRAHETPEELLARKEVEEAVKWCAAFEASGPGPGAGKGAQTAVEACRARFQLQQLEALRSQGDGAEVRARLAKQPDTFLAEVGMGLHLAAGRTTSVEATAPINVEVVAPELERPVKSLCSDLIDQYVGLKGNIIRASNVVPFITELNFTCSRCGAEFAVPTKEGRFDWPSSCKRKCRFARFSVNRERSGAIDWQRLRLQEDFLEFSSGSGPSRGMPRTVDCDLKRGLVGSCVPGDVATLYGIVRFMPTGGVMAHGGEGRQAPSRALYTLCVEVKAVVNARRPEVLEDMPQEDFSPLQLEFIREIYQEPERFPLLVASFCPQIYGQPLVKAALLLSLLGGLPVRAEGQEQRRRGHVHVLLLGDPGLGKSELLRALAQLSPRGVYVSGNSSTSAGLTAAVVRDGSGEMALEAGALVLADNGLCCIDEFDKMGPEAQALLEAMEQQSVSIAKAGIVCTLPARTTVVTAANPSKGTWDRSLTYAQNLKGVMTEALMSRFDVVFLMSDAERHLINDAALSRHIVERRMSAGTGSELVPSSSTALVCVQPTQQAEGRASLKDRCVCVPQDSALPRELLATYLRYAQRYSRPHLGPAAQRRIKEFYAEQRRSLALGGGQMAVTPRQLEGLIRLSEARAKAELRRVVLASDVEDVIEVVRAGSDFEESLAIAPVRKGKTKSNTYADQLRQYMERRIRAGGGREFREQELLEFLKRSSDVKEQDFDKALQKLNEGENLLLLRSSGKYEFTGTVN